MIHAAAVALIHPYYVHARSQPVPRDPQHVLRFARSLEAVHDDQRQRFPVFLPVTVAEHRDTGFDFDEALFGWRQTDSAGKKKGSQGLQVSALQPAMRPEDGGRERRRLLRRAVLELSSCR